MSYYPGQSIVSAQIGRTAHPDVLGNSIAQALGTYLFSVDKNSRFDINCTVDDSIIVRGKIKINQKLAEEDLQKIIRNEVKKAQYTQDNGYDYKNVPLDISFHTQSSDIGHSVSNGGAGDTVTKIGFASSENKEYLPAPVVLVTKLQQSLDNALYENSIPGLHPDGKLNVLVRYEQGKPTHTTSVVIAAHQDEAIPVNDFRYELTESIIKPVLGNFYDAKKTNIIINGTDKFFEAGPLVDTGVKGKKDSDHTYGNLIGTTGGSSYGKDPTKVDLHALLTARHIAKSIVYSELAKAARVELTYAIGHSEPIALSINSFGENKHTEEELEQLVRKYIPLAREEAVQALNITEAHQFLKLSPSFFMDDSHAWEQPVVLQ